MHSKRVSAPRLAALLGLSGLMAEVYRALVGARRF